MEQTVIEQRTGANGQTATATVPGKRDAAPTARVVISARFLLGIYLILPLCLLAMILDLLFWDGALVKTLPTSPESFFLFQILFGTPHIIASTIILASNRDYLGTYWVRLLLFTLFLLLFFGIGSLFIPYDVFLAIVGAATVLHVFKQQVGVGKGLCRLSGGIFDVWGWTLIAFGSILYYAIYSANDAFFRTTAWGHALFWTFTGLALVLTLLCQTRVATVTGALYLWANTLMVVQSSLFYWLDYSFLAILGPRLVHDLTAFTFYVAHDVNRSGTAAENMLYRLARKLRLGVYWVGPALALVLTYLIGRFIDPLAHLVIAPVLGYDLPYAASFIIVGYLGLLHYYTEAFTWRKGSPYRRHVVLTA
jgi:hypothetical protein